MSTVIKIGILSYPGVMRSALHGLGEIFEVSNRIRLDYSEASWPRLEWSYWSTDTDSVPNLNASSHSLITQAISTSDQSLDVIVVPPWMENIGADEQGAVRSDWLRTQHQNGTVLASACAGAFLLAQAGALNARRATTHWGLADDLKASFPEIIMCEEELLIDDGDIITAGGMMAWMDLALRIVERFAGPFLAMKLSKYFLIDTGARDQRYYQSFVPNFGHGDPDILVIQQWLQIHFKEAISVKGLADDNNLTERTLQRRFAKATGHAPSVYIAQLRLQKSRELLESSQMLIDEVVWQVGYEDQSSFRKLFKAHVGLTPSEYRKRFKINS
ncbi:GlxA family transcriptional regulator [Kiloniella antarctica]|uniref:GlxA family transcriptional regulator n=1 Tax=Kiloniella antarctica TaxID=1550907 RepID=A0ABW5BN06_9PROT